MKLLLLEDIKYKDINEIKEKLESYYISKNDSYEALDEEFLLLKTLGTFVRDTLYLWLNESIIPISDYTFQDVKIDEKYLNIIFSETIPNKSVFDQLYCKFFLQPKLEYEIFYIPLTFTINIKYYGKIFTSFYDFYCGEYTYDPLVFSMNDMQRYYSKYYNARTFWRRSNNKFYLVAENNKFVNYIEIEPKSGEVFKADSKIKDSFIDNFIKKKYNTSYSVIAEGEVSKIYLQTGYIATVDFLSDKVVKEEKVLPLEELLEKAKKLSSIQSIKYYSFYKNKVYINVQNDERELLIIMDVNGKLLEKYQILKKKGLKKILDFNKFSEVKIKRTQYPILDEEYIPGYYDIIAYDHDFQLTYRVYDDGKYELISRQILIATAIEKCEKYLKNERLVKFPIFRKENSKYNADMDSWILTFSGRNVQYSLKVYTKDDEIVVEPVEVKTTKERMEYLFKKILDFKVESISSRKHIFSGKEIWIIKYKTHDGLFKVMKLMSEDELLRYYKKGIK